MNVILALNVVRLHGTYYPWESLGAVYSFPQTLAVDKFLHI